MNKLLAQVARLFLFAFSTSASALRSLQRCRASLRFTLPLPSRSSVFPCHGATPLS